MQRPTGVTILAVLAVIGGVIGLLGLVGLTALGGFAAAPLLMLLALASIVLSFAFAIGAFQLKPWGWTLGIVTQGVNLLSALVTIIQGGSIGSVLVSIAISIAILAYLFQPNIRAAFNR